MSAIRVQIHLKCFFDDDSSQQFHNFWYAFQPSRLSTIKDVLEDLRLNYLKNQLSLLTEDNDEQPLILHLEDGQLLPFTSSQVLRDNDRLTLMPLTKYKLHKESLQNSTILNLSSSIVAEPPPTISKNNQKRSRIESNEQNIPLESTITIPTPVEHVEEQPRAKKTKTKTIEEQVVQPPVIQPIPKPPAAQPTLPPLQESVIEKETTSEAPLSFPSTNSRIRELKSKTPAWKAQPPVAKGNTEDKMHIRFDSDSDEESPSQTRLIIEEKKPEESLPYVNGSNSSVRIHYVPSSVPADIVSSSAPANGVSTSVSTSLTPISAPANGVSISVSTSVTPTSAPANGIEKPKVTIAKKKPIDLLFEVKQHKTPEEKEGKKLQQQYGRKRAQHKKRALDYFSMANFVDQAFGLDKADLEKQFSSNGYDTSSSSPQTLPTSFNKLARLPLVAEAIDDNDKIYDLYPPITQCPPIQTRIAFKSLELSEDFCPKMSAFKEGTVVDVNETTKELTIQLDQPLATVFNQPSKFYAPADDLLEENSATVILPFSDLHAARFLPTSNETTAT